MFSISRQPQSSLQCPMDTNDRQFLYKNLHKEKKIFKKINKKKDLSRRTRQWTKFEKLNYARVLLKTMIHDVPVGQSQELSRSPKQVHAFHKRMISQFRSKKEIIRQLLGDNLQKASQKRERALIRDHERSERRSGTIFKWEGLIDTNSQQCCFQSEDLSYVQNFLFIEKSPDEMCCDDDLIIEISDLEDDSQDNESYVLNSEQQPLYFS